MKHWRRRLKLDARISVTKIGPDFRVLGVNGRGRFVNGLLHEGGANLVEFALASTVLFAMVFGILETCLALYNYDYLSQAAREGTRWAMVRGSASCTNTPGLVNCKATANQIQTYVQGLGYPFSGSLTVNSSWPNGSNSPGNTVQVQVQYTYSLSIPFVRPISIPMSSTSIMVISQ
jgi:Flp pilus assembly protein TadG